MPKPEARPAKRVAGRSKFRLPERAPRAAEVNPLRELLQEARAQEEAVALGESQAPSTPANYDTGVAETRTRRVNKRRAAKRDVASRAPSEGLETFETFSARWSAILRPGQLKVCRALFEMSYALGRADCFTSMPKLAEAAGLKERQCYYVVAQLEALGFVERPEIFNTSTLKGTVFQLHAEPLPASARAARLYYVGNEKREE